jgi:hypothetical protein
MVVTLKLMLMRLIVGNRIELARSVENLASINLCHICLVIGIVSLDTIPD